MVKIRRIEETEKSYWDIEIQKYDGVHPLNAFEWGCVRRVDKWDPIYLVAESKGRFRGAMMVLVKKIAYTPYSIIYSPKGPVWNCDDHEVLTELVREVRRLGSEKKAIFLRIDPNIREDAIGEMDMILARFGFIHLDKRWTFWNSPRDVYRIDLTRMESDEKLFNMLDRDTRRCIRKAEKDGVIIAAATEERELREFYNIFREFSVAKGFMARGYEYQKALWEAYIKPNNGRLFLAKYKDRIIGGLVCIKFGRKCLAMHMGTPYKYQKLQTYYAYVWESIRWAKTEGCLWYSFRGVGTTPSQEYFKSKFLPEVVRLVGYYDLPLRPLLYKMFYSLEFTVLPRAWPFIISMREKLHKTRAGNVGKEKAA